LHDRNRQAAFSPHSLAIPQFRRRKDARSAVSTHDNKNKAPVPPEGARRSRQDGTDVKNAPLALAAAAGLTLMAPQAPANAFSQTGIGSYYGNGHHGKRTASGERFNQGAMTAAHRTAAFGTNLRVTNLANGRSVVVRVNDRGPFVRGRVVDISSSAARQIGMQGRGLARVRVEKQ
jgi:rare lipoprotein A